jgi:hypothetical protein
VQQLRHGNIAKRGGLEQNHEESGWQDNISKALTDPHFEWMHGATIESRFQ